MFNGKCAFVASKTVISNYFCASGLHGSIYRRGAVNEGIRVCCSCCSIWGDDSSEEHTTCGAENHSWVLMTCKSGAHNCHTSEMWHCTAVVSLESWPDWFFEWWTNICAFTLMLCVHWLFFVWFGLRIDRSVEFSHCWIKKCMNKNTIKQQAYNW